MHDCLVCGRCITKDEDIPTFRWPIEKKDLLREYCSNMNVPQNMVGNSSRICGCHFKESQLCGGAYRRRIKKGEVPTLHPFRRPKIGRRRMIDDQSDIIRLNPKGDG